MTFPELKDWLRLSGTFDTRENKKVERVDFQLEANDAVSSTTGIDRKPIYFTDLQFQAGKRLTGWVPNTQEFMKKLTWTHDENQYVAAPNTFAGDPPRIYENVDRRWFNITGRGHEVFIVPNYLPEDWDIELLPTGLDITITAKEDFDLLRISTNAGVEIAEEEQFYKRPGGVYQEQLRKYEEVTSSYYSGDEVRKDREISNFENLIRPLLENHPLHTRYTREFYIEAGTAGTEIKIHATPREATVNGEPVQIVGKNYINVDGEQLEIYRNKYMQAQVGATPIRIEFYKLEERSFITYELDDDYNWQRVRKSFGYLRDTGVGYQGTAGFNQWTYGYSRI